MRVVQRKNKSKTSRKSSLWELLEHRTLLSAAFDITGLTALRNLAAFSQIDGRGVGIAVLDTGVVAANPDLSSNVVAFYNAVEDPVNTTDISPSTSVDKDGHGTHVSGIAASSDASIGVAYGADLIDIKVIPDAGEAQLGGDPLLRGLRWVAANYQVYNIKVVNMSLGESGVNDNTITAAAAADALAIQINALEKLGITVISASGNSYANDPTAGESFPAVVSTIGVANTWATSGQASDFGVPFGESGDRFYAIDRAATPDTLASTSQRSTLDNQLAAPGEDIYSTWNGTHDSSNGSDLLHNTLSGTSMATPFVSGVVALMQQAAKYFGGHYLPDPNQILQILSATADTIVDSNNPNNSRYNANTGATSNLPETGFSFKRVNVLKALQEVQRFVTGGSITTGPAPGPDTDNTTTSALPINSVNGTTVYTFSGSVGTDGLVEVGDDDIDLFKLEVTSPGQMTFTLTKPSGGTAFAPTLRLFDSSGSEIATTTGTSGAYPTLTTTGALAVGTYYFGISSAGNQAYTVNGANAGNAAAGGDYTLQISLVNPDPNGTIQGSASVDLTVPNQVLQDSSTGADYTAVVQQGELGSDPPPTGSATRITVSSDVDMFQLTAPDNGTLTLTTTSGPFTGNRTFIELFDSTGAAVKSSTGTSSQNVLSATLTGGATYYIAVTIPGNSAFNPADPYPGRQANGTPIDQSYTLYLRFSNGDINGTALNAISSTTGATVNANIGTDNSATIGATGSKDVDWYTYSATQSGVFNITAQSTTDGLTPVITLWQYTNGNSDIVKVADTSSSGLFAAPSSLFSPSAVAAASTAGSAQMMFQVSSGATFFVAISGQGDSNFNWYALASGSGGQTGNYTLATQLQPLSTLATLSDDSINDGTPQTLAIGQNVHGNLGADGSLVVGDSDVDLYRYVAENDGTIDIRTFTNQEGDADTVLRIFNSSGTQLASNDNINSSTTASEIQLAVVKGQTYYIGVSGAGLSALSYNPLTGTNAGSGSTGSYSLLVSIPVDAPPNVGVMPALSVSGPAPVAGYTDGVAVFTVSLSAPSTTPVTVNYSTADGTAVSGVDYSATSGSLTFAAGVVVQTVSVPILANTSAPQGSVTFTLTLSDAAGATIDTPAATATILDLPVTTLTFSPGHPARYVNAAGRAVNLVLSGPGSGKAVFLNGGLDPTQITLTNTTLSSTFAIRTTATTIADIAVTGSLRSLIAGSTTLTGNLNLSGSLGKLTLGDVNGSASGGVISIGGAAIPTAIKLGRVTNASLAAAGAIPSLRAEEWLQNTANASTISAGRIGSFTIDGNFAARVFASAMNTIRLGSDSGTLTAGAIGRLTVAGAMSSATVNLTDAGMTLQSLTVGGVVSASKIVSTGDIGRVTVGAFLDSTLFAGVNPSLTSLPASSSDFAADASIMTFRVTATKKPYSFSNSNIAAASIGQVVLARVNPGNSGNPFGIAAKTLDAFTNRGVIKWTKRSPPSLLTPDGDFVVRLLG